MKRLLVLSNGAGEDAIAARILQKLSPSLRPRVVCCPLLGAGHALSDFELCGPRVMPPSEGLFRESWRLALRDLAYGVAGGHLDQLRSLRRNRRQVALTVAVGDLFPVLWGLLGVGGPVLFVGTAKSVYHHRYSPPERWILRRFVAKSLVRDAATAAELVSGGIDAEWLGNAMMDEVQPSGAALPFQSGPVVTLFPGSRGKAPAVLSYQLEVLEEVRKRVLDLQAGVALAPGMDRDLLVQPALAQGWCLEEGSRLRRHDLTVHLLSGVLGDLLAASSVALGQAGTANEQAAGAGVPVVAYEPGGKRGLRWYRKRQMGLLGEAVSVVSQDKETIARELVRLLTDREEHRRRARIGRERMGPPGGSERMAAAITQAWNDAWRDSSD